MKLGIYIPSRGRAGRVRTLSAVPQARLTNTHVVVRPEEGIAYKVHYRGLVLKCTPSVCSIGTKRDWIVKHAQRVGYTHIIMLDDDLYFYGRNPVDVRKFVGLKTDSEKAAMFDALEAALKTYVHVGMLSKEGSNNEPNQTQTAVRMCRVLGYCVKTLVAEKVKFTRLPLMEDFDVTLKLLRLGYLNGVLGAYANNQRVSNEAGGCSGYRTMALQEQAAYGLRALHSDFVKVVHKEPKLMAWDGEARTDVRIQWKKAYANSLGGKL